MRLNQYEKDVIAASARKNFGENTRVILFGSRADDTRRGGDIDLVVTPDIYVSPEEMLEKKIRMLIDLEQKLGEQKIDIIIQQINDSRAIIKTAEKTGIAIC